jgi:hypothetical protein
MQWIGGFDWVALVPCLLPKEQKLHWGRLPTTGMVVMGAGSTQRPHLLASIADQVAMLSFFFQTRSSPVS